MSCLQIIPDPAFLSGFNILSQKDHSDNDRVTLLGTKKCDGNLTPVWNVATWDSGPCLWENRIETDEYSISDGKWRCFSVNKADGSASFTLDSSLYYNGKGAVHGDYWPHLLLENGRFGDNGDSRFYRCSMDRLIFKIDLRMTEYSRIVNPDDWVEAAQFLCFFYLKGIKNDDFIWFGIKLFDSRSMSDPPFIAYDGGKPDASGKLIYHLGTNEAYDGAEGLWKNGQPSADGEWKSVCVDMKPHLNAAFNRAKQDGAIKSDGTGDLFIDGMNIGFETIGTFRHTIEIKNMGLFSYYD